jgi:hypothetical protein
MTQEWKALTPYKPKILQNTAYFNTEILFVNIKPWTDFPTYETIRQFSYRPGLRTAVHDEVMAVQSEFLASEKGNHLPEARSENTVVESLGAFFTRLNKLLEATPNPQGNELFVQINGGKSAKKRREGGTPLLKDPDRVACWWDGVHARIDGQDTAELGVKEYTTPKIPCLIVGDFKMYFKFNWDMLNTAAQNPEADWKEPQKVLNQIHDYMDMHNDKYGYIITETELIFFRRVGSDWGHVEYSPRIPLQAERGQLNAMLVLWFFHVKYAIWGLDGGWELPSFYSTCPRKRGGGRPTVEPRVKKNTCDAADNDGANCENVPGVEGKAGGNRKTVTSKRENAAAKKRAPCVPAQKQL